MNNAQSEGRGNGKGLIASPRDRKAPLPELEEEPVPQEVREAGSGRRRSEPLTLFIAIGPFLAPSASKQKTPLLEWERGWGEGFF